MNPTTEHLKRTLTRVGLSEVEQKVYLTVLRLGAKPVGAIAKAVGLKRGQTYNIVDELLEKGIVQEFTKSGVRQVTVNSPENLMVLLESREAELKTTKKLLSEAIPFLEIMQTPALSPSAVKFFRGVDGIRSLYEDTLTVGEDIYAVGDFGATFPVEESKELNDWIWNYAKRRASAGIHYYGIINKSAHSDLAYRRRVAQKRSLKMLEGVSLPVEINIYGGKVAMMSSANEKLGLLIEDVHVAETLRNLHRAVWGGLPDYCA